MRHYPVAACVLLAATGLAPPAAAATAAVTPAPAPMTTTRVTYGDRPNETMTIVNPGTGTRSAVLFVHGGGWERAEADVDELALARRLAATSGWIVAAADYPTAGPPYRSVEPAAIDGALRTLASRPGINPGDVSLWGESAGANLALLTAYRHPRHVAGVVSISGPTDMATEWSTPATILVTGYEQAPPQVAAHRYRATSPISAVTTASPRTFQAVADDDDLVPPSEVGHLASLLSKAGVHHRQVVVHGTDHANPVEYDVPPGRTRTVAAIAVAFLRKTLPA
jgi:acetyl esterase/lipase